MTTLQRWWVRWHTALADRVGARTEQDRDRGDVPGWVLVTVMSALLVIVLLAAFRDRFVSLINDTIDGIQ